MPLHSRCPWYTWMQRPCPRVFSRVFCYCGFCWVALGHAPPHKTDSPHCAALQAFALTHSFSSNSEENLADPFTRIGLQHAAPPAHFPNLRLSSFPLPLLLPVFGAFHTSSLLSLSSWLWTACEGFGRKRTFPVGNGRFRPVSACSHHPLFRGSLYFSDHFSRPPHGISLLWTQDSSWLWTMNQLVGSR